MLPAGSGVRLVVSAEHPTFLPAAAGFLSGSRLCEGLG